MSEKRPISEAWAKVINLAIALGVENINALPGCWIHKVDAHWTIAVNGHREPCLAEPDGCMKAEVRPFGVVAWWHGWIAGEFDARGGSFVLGSEAYENRFIAHLEAATERATREKLPR